MFYKRLFSNLFLSLIFICFPGTGRAGAAVLYTTLTADSLMIGDKIEYTVSIVAAKNSSVKGPTSETDFGSVTLKNRSEEKFSKSNADSLVFRYLLTSYIVEQCTIPPLSYVIQNESKVDTIVTKLIPLRVLSAIDAKEGDTIRLKDLKPQQNAGTPPYWPYWVAGLVLLSILAGILIYIYRKKRTLVNIVPLKPPYEEAMEALTLLESKKYLSKGMIREQVFELSLILKRYTGRRYEAPVDDMTTEEISSWIATSPLGEKEKQRIVWFFSTTHPVKFAKLIPELEVVHRLTQEVRTFVEETKPSLNQESKLAGESSNAAG